MMVSPKHNQDYCMYCRKNNSERTKAWTNSSPGVESQPWFHQFSFLREFRSFLGLFRNLRSTIMLFVWKHSTLHRQSSIILHTILQSKNQLDRQLFGAALRKEVRNVLGDPRFIVASMVGQASLHTKTIQNTVELNLTETNGHEPVGLEGLALASIAYEWLPWWFLVELWN